MSDRLDDINKIIKKIKKVLVGQDIQVTYRESSDRFYVFINEELKPSIVFDRTTLLLLTKEIK